MARLQARRTGLIEVMETLIYLVWRPCFTFFETAGDERVHFCLKKDRAWPNKITARFQEAI